MNRLKIPRSVPARWACAVLAGWLLQTAAWAQYKVVGPDGSITYTDRPPTQAGAQVQPMRRDGSPAGTSTGSAAPNTASGSTANLPFELRNLVARFPVTLYTGSDCAPCTQARSLLALRGVPFAERTVTSDDDIASLQRLTNGRSLPALAVGAQVLRGFQEQDWTSTLDLAGYPKESRLPRTWQAPPATPLVARATPPQAPVETIPLTGPPARGADRLGPPLPGDTPPTGPAIRF